MSRQGRKSNKKHSASSSDKDRDRPTSPGGSIISGRTTVASVKQPESLAFKVLSRDQTQSLLSCSTPEDAQSMLAENFKLTDYLFDLKTAAILDYYVDGFWFAKEEGLDTELASAFLTILHTLLDNIRKKQSTVKENIESFREMLLLMTGGGDAGRQSVPPMGGAVYFTPVQCKTISTYLMQAFFQHHSLYEYLFGYAQAEEIIGTDVGIQFPEPASMPWPPPLDEGVFEDMFLERIAPPSMLPEIHEEEAPAEGAVEEADANAENTEDEAPKEEEAVFNLKGAQIAAIIDLKTKQLLEPVKVELEAKVREKENACLAKINKIHKPV